MYAHRFTPVKSVFWRWGQKSSAQFFFLHFALDKIAVVKTLFFLFWRLVLHEIRANVDFTNFLSSRYPLPPFFFTYLMLLPFRQTAIHSTCSSRLQRNCRGGTFTLIMRRHPMNHVAPLTRILTDEMMLSESTSSFISRISAPAFLPRRGSDLGRCWFCLSRSFERGRPITRPV